MVLVLWPEMSVRFGGRYNGLVVWWCGALGFRAKWAHPNSRDFIEGLWVAMEDGCK